MRIRKILARGSIVDNQDRVNNAILKLVKKRNQIIYGARSIQAQNNLFARNTKDYDVFDKQPKKSAELLQRELDKVVGFDYYFKKEAEHKGTWKVKGKGIDMKANTPDDESIADFTKPDSKVPFIVKNGIRYRILREELMKKQATVRDPEFKFRHEKDKDDIRRIKGYLKVQRLLK